MALKINYIYPLLKKEFACASETTKMTEAKQVCLPSTPNVRGAHQLQVTHTNQVCIFGSSRFLFTQFRKVTNEEIWQICADQSIAL